MAQYEIGIGKIPVTIPDEVEQFLKEEDYPAGHLRDHWVAQYEQNRVVCRLSAESFDRVMYELLSLGLEPTTALSAYNTLCRAHDKVGSL